MDYEEHFTKHLDLWLENTFKLNLITSNMSLFLKVLYFIMKLTAFAEKLKDNNNKTLVFIAEVIFITCQKQDGKVRKGRKIKVPLQPENFFRGQ
jgi:hypothetical protein